jgi:superfamily II DNA/RNA helicase
MADIMPEYESSDEEKPKEDIKKKDQGANLTGWNELFLKEELKRAIRECGFEHPSEVQVETIPMALQGQDILCQAKSGMGKTAVFVISILNQISPTSEEAYEPHQAIITCHTRELAHQIFKDFKRLGRYFKKPELRFGCYFGGVPLEDNEAELKDPAKTPHIIICTPGRLYDLAKHKLIQFDKVLPH